MKDEKKVKATKNSVKLTDEQLAKVNGGKEQPLPEQMNGVTVTIELDDPTKQIQCVHFGEVEFSKKQKEKLL